MKKGRKEGKEGKKERKEGKRKDGRMGGWKEALCMWI